MAQAVSPSTFSRLEKTVLFQDKFFPEAVRYVDRIFVMDRSDYGYPIVGIRGVQSDLRINGLFNLSRAKNVAIDLAIREGYDWLYDADADRVLTELSLPETPLSHVPVYWATEKDGGEDLARRAREKVLPLTSGSFFVVSREVFTKVRFCEDFQITRWDDVDFVFNICSAAGFHVEGQGGRGIHLWHSDQERCYDREDCNSALYRKRQKMFAKGGK